jgi:hypothetical protein
MSSSSSIGAAASNHVSRWGILLARLGLVARGVVYLTIGALAFLAAFTTRGQTTDREGAVQQIGRQPFGDFLLWALAVGILGYILWRWAQAFFDFEREGSHGKALLKRLGYFASGAAYGGLLVATIKTATGLATKGGDRTTQDWTATLLQQPFGRWIVGLVAAIIVGIAVFQFIEAIRCLFARHIRGGELTAEQERWAIRAGRAGHAARGIAFLLIGWFMAQAALEERAAEAGGMAQALETLARQSHGTLLLGAVGAGLALFGIYSFVEARYRQIRTGKTGSR